MSDKIKRNKRPVEPVSIGPAEILTIPCKCADGADCPHGSYASIKVEPDGGWIRTVRMNNQSPTITLVMIERQDLANMLSYLNAVLNQPLPAATRAVMGGNHVRKQEPKP